METISASVSGTSARREPRAGTILRASAVGLSGLVLGGGAHVLSGGALPSSAVLAGLAALSVLGASLVARAGLPGWAILVTLGVGQQVLHWLLGSLGGGATSITGGRALHHDDGVPVGGSPTQGHSPEVMLMLHLHLAVALVLGWLVVRYPQLTHWLRRRRGGTTEGTPDRRRRCPRSPVD